MKSLEVGQKRYEFNTMKKNVVFMLNIDMGNNRNTPYHYSINSWKKWCKDNDIFFFELNELIADPNDLHVNVQKWWALDVLELNLKGKYDQVCVVDADTIIHPDSPNFFDLTDNEFCAVNDNGSFEWVLRSINGWGDSLFPNQKKINIWEYWNSGFVVYSRKHLEYINSIQKFFMENNKNIEKYRKIIKASSDQTICNYILESETLKVKLLPECWNLQHLFKKDLLHFPNYSWWEDKLLFLDAGYIYHFNGIPNWPQFIDRPMGYWMERTYRELYDNK